MKTFTQKPAEVQRKWYIVDATGVPLGRIASQVAAILRGKNKPEFTPYVDCGDFVIVLNSDKLVLTGRKAEEKYYRYHTGYVGGLKEIVYSDLLKNKSDFVIREAVKGMLPKNSIGRKMLKKLRVYRNEEQDHEAQKPIKIEIVGKRG